MAFIFQKVGRGKAEIFKILKNGSTAAIGQGRPVCYDYTTKADGLAVIIPTTAMLSMFAGVVAHGKTLAASGEDGEYGKVQVYGHHASVKLGGSTVIPGSPLAPVNSTYGYMACAVTFTGTYNTTAGMNSDLIFAVAGTTGLLFATSVADSKFDTGSLAFIRAL